MNGQSGQPPDKGKPNEIPLQSNELILNEIEIKQEAVKQEPEDVVNMVMVPSSERAASGSVIKFIRDEQKGGTSDFTNICGMAEVKSEAKKEEINKKAEKDSTEFSGNNAIGSPSPKDKKNFRSNRKQSKPRRKSLGNKKATRHVATTSKPKTKIRSNKKKSVTSKGTGKQHKCSSCHYITSKKFDLIKHIRKHTGEKPFPCTHCAKRFSQKQHLQSHMHSHVSEFLFSCSNCLKGFDHNEEKMKHEADCTIRHYKCHLCKEFTTFQKINLKCHMRVHHTGERPFGCNQCSKKFPRQIELKYHLKSHINPRPLKFNCSVCYRNFSQPIEKDEHEVKCMCRGYECYLCKEFTSNVLTNLDNHMRTHTGLKPFQCKMCQKAFSRKYDLQRHVSRRHIQK